MEARTRLHEKEERQCSPFIVGRSETSTRNGLMIKFGKNTRKRSFHPVCYKATHQLMLDVLFYFFQPHRTRRVPVHIRSPLLQHGLLPCENLIWVQDVKEVDGHEERHRDVLPHGVGHVVLWVDRCVLARKAGGEVIPAHLQIKPATSVYSSFFGGYFGHFKCVDFHKRCLKISNLFKIIEKKRSRKRSIFYYFSSGSRQLIC